MKRYRDFYGGTATISRTRDGRYRLKIAAKYGPVHTNKVYNTERGARIAMARSSDCWEEIDSAQK